MKGFLCYIPFPPFLLDQLYGLRYDFKAHTCMYDLALQRMLITNLNSLRASTPLPLLRL